MEATLAEIRATFDCGIWYPVISSMLMMPDACGAAEYWGEKKKSRDRYIDWYDNWVLPLFGSPQFRGSTVYIIRNAMIHESTGFTRGEHGFDRILFMPPNREHGLVELVTISDDGGSTDTVLAVTIKGFMEAMDQAVRHWLAEVRGDNDKRRENAVSKLVQYRPGGLEPFIVGLPVVC